MHFREATIADITQMQIVRHAVKENRLSDPSLVPDKDVHDYIVNRGKGWVCEVDNIVVGFAIVSLTDNNVWALFVDPIHEKKGIGKKLHNEMLNWYFNNTSTTVWLSTATGTRAEIFYRNAGWRQTGITRSGEIKFEMDIADWKKSLQQF